MTLRKKTLLSIGITMICLLIALYGISSTLFLGDFIKLERERVVNSAERISNILHDDLSALSSAVGDWAAWDDTYSFIKDGDPLYVKKNLPDETYSDLKLNLILFVDSSGEVIFGRGFDLLQKKGLPVHERLKERIITDSVFLRHNSVDSSVQGIILLPEGPMLVASRPILTSERKGPIRGSMIFGRYLNDEEIYRWSEITKLSVKMYPVDAIEKFTDLKESRFNPERDSIFVKPIDSKIISGYIVVKDVHDKPALLFRIDVPRHIYQQGRVTLNRFVLLLFASGVIFGVVILFLVEKSVLSRLTRLGSEVRDISAKGRHSLRVSVDGGDELASIGDDINSMLKSLERSHSLINAVIEDLPEGVVLLNSEYRVVLANAVGLQHLKRLSNAGMGDVLTHIGRNSIIEMVANFSHPSHVIRQNIRVGNFFFDVTGKYIGKSRDVGIVLVTTDVTQEKAELMERIQSRENLSAVGQLAAGIAHDFNNILTSVIGYAGLLYADSTLSDKVRNQLKIILHSAERAVELVRQILDFSRKSFSEFEVIDLSLYLEDFLKFIKRTIPENININIEFKPGQYRIKADRTKLQQVLTNLSLNAKDAMPAGGDIVFALSRISVDKNGIMLVYDIDMLPEGDWVVLSISDSGMGIPSDVLPRIFEPFYTTKEVGRGTGLGLSQVYGIVKQHEGYIDVDSSPGSGTTFTIYLPETKEKTGFVSEPERPKDLPKGAGETLLIVEDSPAVLEFISSSLIALGYDVLTAQNTKDALSIFEERNGNISLVITDMVMPGMNGLKFIKMLREINPSIKAIVISGYPLGLDSDMRDISIIASLQKPLKVQDLADTVRGALDKQVNF